MSKDIKVSISQLNDVIVIDIQGDITAVTGEVVQETYITDSIADDWFLVNVYAC